MNDSSNNPINLPLQHSSNQNITNINIIPSPMPLRTSPPPPIPSMPLPPPPLPRISNIFSTLILQQQDPSNNIMRLWSHAIFEDSDEEMVDVEENIATENIPINNFIQTNMTIQTMNERMANWSSRHRYIPLINNFINKVIINHCKPL